MRYLRFAFLLALALVLVTVAFANRDLVTLRLLPDDVARHLPWGWSISLPLFLVIFAAIIFGVILGFIWEWLREHHLRAEAARDRREKERLRSEVDRLRGAGAETDDDILRLLDSGPARR